MSSFGTPVSGDHPVALVVLAGGPRVFMQPSVGERETVAERAQLKCWE